MTQNAYIEVMQDRLDWCVEKERYEMAAKLRDLIIYESTDDKKFKHQYYLWEAFVAFQQYLWD